MKSLVVSTMTAAILLAGCGHPTGAADSSAPDHTNTTPNASGLGDSANSEPKLTDGGALFLPDATLKAMSLTMAKATPKAFTSAHGVSFQIFREAGEKPIAGLIYRFGYAYGLVLQEGDISEFKVGQIATVLSETDPTKVRNAKVISIDRLPEGSDSTWEIVLEINDTSNRLELAQSCTASFSDSTTRTGLVIPKSAALKASDGTYVYLQIPEGYKRVSIKTGDVTDNDIEVTVGLKAGDLVVSSPVQLLWLTELRLRGGNRG